MVPIESIQIKQYLKRLRLTQKPPTLEYLEQLQENHLLYIPFENLDVMSKQHIELKYSKLFDKIINNNRGGFCFELNGLFGFLLGSLGFNVYMIEAGVYNDKLKGFGVMRNHMTLIVTIENQIYLTDVGFGDSFRKPISFRDKTTEDVSGKYRIVEYEASHYRFGRKDKVNEEFDYYILEHSTGENWKPQYKFHYNRKLKLEDYQENCNWIESSPESNFTQGRTWSIAKDDGRVSLSENCITVTKNSEKTKINYNSERDFEYYLKKNLDMLT